MYAITILGYRKDGMSEDDYHNYISKVHAGHLKELLVKHDIVSYRMQHNTAQTRNELLNTILGGHLPEDRLSDCDAIIQIVFKSIDDYLRVREDPHFQEVVNPDHVNFAHPGKTRFVMGWYENHVSEGKVRS